MLGPTVMYLFVALMAAIFGFGGAAAADAGIDRVLYAAKVVVGIALIGAVASYLMDRWNRDA